MKPSELAALFDRDLLKLKSEIQQYPTDAMLWILMPGISNTGGNLTLHLCGNLRHFIGHELGKTGYIRQRDLEFSETGLSRDHLMQLIEQTRSEIIPIVNDLPANRLQDEFPKEIGGKRQSTGYALLHLFGHLSYHLGQVNYHRRISGNGG